MDRVFFSNSGTEAIEGCLKLARLYSRPADAQLTAPNPKHRVLALENSFHGRTFGAVSITATEKYRLPFAPLVPGVEFVKFNDVADLQSKFDKNVCAVILETIQGEGGIHPVSEAFWNRARVLTQNHDALLIADEIQCGLGRTGRHFAYQKFSSKPELVAIAKPLAAGLPLGAILTSEAVAARVSPGVHGTTFGGGPLICAVALEFLKVLDKTKILANAAARGTEIRAGIEKLAQKFSFIKEVRGEGLMIGVELTVDGNPFVAEAMDRGLLINCTHEFTLRLLPAFIISAKQVREFLGILEEVLGHVSKSMPATETARHAAHTAAR